MHHIQTHPNPSEARGQAPTWVDRQLASLAPSGLQDKS